VTQETQLAQGGNVVLAIKPEATILDATCSNRAMWRIKDNKHILFIDIEPELQIKPDIIIDCRKTNLPSESINMVFFDPPHWWGDKVGTMFYTCRNDEDKKELIKKHGDGGYSYYGTDKYPTKSALLSFIHKAQEEFYRIMKNDGVLWLIWSEAKIPLFKILPFFKNWDELIRLQVSNTHQTLSSVQNWWIMFMKKPNPVQHIDLTEFCENRDKEVDR